MLSEAVIKRVLEEALENEYWKEVYESAPTEKGKRYWEMNFCYSAGCDGELTRKQFNEASKGLDEAMQELGIDDWEYIMKYCGSWQYKSICRKRIEELKARGEQ